MMIDCKQQFYWVIGSPDTRLGGFLCMVCLFCQVSNLRGNNNFSATDIGNHHLSHHTSECVINFFMNMQIYLLLDLVI